MSKQNKSINKTTTTKIAYNAVFIMFINIFNISANIVCLISEVQGGTTPSIHPQLTINDRVGVRPSCALRRRGACQMSFP